MYTQGLSKEEECKLQFIIHIHIQGQNKAEQFMNKFFVQENKTEHQK